MHLTFFVVVGLTAQCVFSESVEGSTSNEEPDEEFLKSIDELIERDTLNDCEAARRLLREYRKESGDHASLLWRLANCYFCLETFIEDEPSSTQEKRALLEKGLKYAKSALRLNDTDPDAHKWFGVLTGEKGKTMDLTNQARAGITFKKHLDRARQLRPDDASIHHLIGIFEYEIGKLSWFEKSMASAIFDDFPESTIDDAIKSFLLAAKYKKKPWKMNCVYLAKSYLLEKKFSDAKEWLNAAEGIEVKTREDKIAAGKIVALRKRLK